MARQNYKRNNMKNYFLLKYVAILLLIGVATNHTFAQEPQSRQFASIRGSNTEKMAQEAPIRKWGWFIPAETIS